MKNLIVILCTIILTGACKNHNLVKTADNKKLVMQYFDYFNAHEWIKMANMYIDTAQFKDPSFGSGIIKQSRQQIIEKYTALNKIFPDIKDSITKMYLSEDSYVVVEFISRGTAQDNSVFTIPVCTIFTVENGMITKDFTYYDNFEEK